MSGVWVGWSSDTLTFFRLTLLPDGTGVLASSFLRRAATLSRVRTWTLQGFKIAIDTTPVDDSVDSTRLTGSLFVQRLDLRIAATNGSWKVGLTLYRESDFLLSLRETTIRTEQEAGARTPP
jgi:hypothetical protein